MKTKSFKFPKSPFKTKGGAKVPHRKNTAHQESVIMPSPKQVTIPMQQHIGAPCKPVVKAGTLVYVGTLIGKSDAFVSAPIHSSVSGKVKRIVSVTMPSGNEVDAVLIESDGEMTPCPDIKPPVVETKEDLINAVKESGLVGLGGAGFPAFIKLNVPQDKKIDTLIINMAECEPYITADHREAIENSFEVLSGVYAVKELLGIDRVIIGVEDNKPDVIKELRKIADSKTNDPDDRVRILPLKARYPQGAEKVLVKACTNRVIEAGKLPSDVGCIVMNVTSVAFIAMYLKTGMPLVSKRITIDGSAIQEPKNVIVPIGTSINEVIEFCGGYKEEPKKILMGGPMMGIALKDDTSPVIKQNNAILAFAEKEAKLDAPTACIRCGKCADSCPMNLFPPLISRAIKLKEFENLEKYGVMTCMECGSCAFNCPAKKPIVQNMRLGKTVLKEHKAKEELKAKEEQAKEELKAKEQAKEQVKEQELENKEG